LSTNGTINGAAEEPSVDDALMTESGVRSFFASIRPYIVTFFGPGIITIVIPWVILRSGAALNVEIGAGHYLGMIVLVAGVGIACWCMWAFVALGHGTPTSTDPPKVLVARGLYRVVRNPMYCGVLLIVFGEALWFESAGLALHGLISWLGLHLFVVLYEEPALRGRFGARYEEYCEKVARWIPHKGLLQSSDRNIHRANGATLN
jgi:protein-S-isoprenylcysteine O-methyltransferase Ste14